MSGIRDRGLEQHFFPDSQQSLEKFPGLRFSLTFRRAPPCGRARIAAEGMDGWRRHQRRNRAARSPAHFSPSRRGPHWPPRDATAARIGGSRRRRLSTLHTPRGSRTRGARGRRNQRMAHGRKMRATSSAKDSPLAPWPGIERPRRQSPARGKRLDEVVAFYPSPERKIRDLEARKCFGALSANEGWMAEERARLAQPRTPLALGGGAARGAPLARRTRH